MNAVTLLAMLTSAAAAQYLVEGNPAAAVRVIIYEDLQCPDCAALRRMLDEKLLPRYGAKVAFEHREFPLPRHSWARQASIAARFFQSLNLELAIAYHRYCLANLKATNAANFKDRLTAFARERGVDPQEALAALDDPALAAAVDKEYQEGVARGVSRTPTAFVNGAAFIETFTFEEISKGIEAALAEAR